MKEIQILDTATISCSAFILNSCPYFEILFLIPPLFFLPLPWNATKVWEFTV